MQSFKDKTGREWTIRITIGAAKRVRQEIPGVDLTELDKAAEGMLPLGVRLTLEPIFACDVIFALVKDQAQAGGVSDVDFGELMEGPVLGPAMQALNQELLDFFRALGRNDIVQLLEQNRRMLDAVVQENQRAIDKLEAELRAGTAGTQGESPPTTGSSSTDSPES